MEIAIRPQVSSVFIRKEHSVFTFIDESTHWFVLRIFSFFRCNWFLIFNLSSLMLCENLFNNDKK
jgi:hypothetical protein